MRALIAYYSRSGVTRKVAELLQEKMGCDLEEIKDLKNRKGILGFLTSGYSAYAKRLTDISKPEKDPFKYDLVILGTPVWAGKMTPAARTYISWLKTTGALGKINMAFFSLSGSDSDSKKVVKALADLTGKEAKATLTLKESNVVDSDSMISNFASSVQA